MHTPTELQIELDFMNGKEVKQVSKDSQRDINRSKREIEREIADLARMENDLISKIQIAHKKGRSSEVKLLAKQLITVRENKERLVKTTGQLTEVSMKVKTLATNAVVASSIGSATKALGAVNDAIDVKSIMQTMNQYTLENDKMELATESWDDMIDVFDGEDVESESNAVVDQVLDELGINITSQLNMLSAPTTSINSNTANNVVSSGVARQQAKAL